MAHSPSPCPRPARLLVAGLLATLAQTAVVAQSTRTCRDSNAYCRTLDTSGLPNTNEFAIEQVPDSLGKKVVGISLYTKAVSGSQTVPIYIYRGTPGRGPTGGPVGTGTIQVSSTLKWHKGQFQQPVTIPANVTYYIGLNAGGILHARCKQTDAPLAYFWRNPIMPSWVGPRASAQWAFREECSGGAPTAKVSPFGTACPGTGITPLSRFSPNLPCSRPTSYEWPVQTAIEVPVSTQAYTIRRIGLPTVAKGQAITVTVRVLGANASGAPATQLASVVIPVTVNRGMQSATLTTPYRVAANQQVFLAFDAQGIDIPNCTDNHIRLKSWQLYSDRVAPGPTAALVVSHRSRRGARFARLDEQRRSAAHRHDEATDVVRGACQCTSGHVHWGIEHHLGRPDSAHRPLTDWRRRLQPASRARRHATDDGHRDRPGRPPDRPTQPSLARGTTNLRTGIDCRRTRQRRRGDDNQRPRYLHRPLETEVACWAQ